MNKEEMKAKLEKNVEYLRRNIPPDDIYLFCEHVFTASVFFLHKWSCLVDLNEECARNPVVKRWVTNIINFQKCKEQELDVDVDFDTKIMEDND